MSHILSEEEKERIRREQLRKIAELEKKKKLSSSGVSVTQKMFVAEAKQKQKDRVKEEFEKKIFEEEMRQRGFVKYGDDWISKEEFLQRKKEEEEKEKKLKEKLEKAKERKIDKAEEEYENLVIDNEERMGKFQKVVYIGIALAMVGTIIALVFGAKFVGIAVVLQIIGALMAVGTMVFLFEIECKLMKAQRFIYEGEIYDFEYNDISSPVRKILRFFAKKYDPTIAMLFREEHYE